MCFIKILRRRREAVQPLNRSDSRKNLDALRRESRYKRAISIWNNFAIRGVRWRRGELRELKSRWRGLSWLAREVQRETGTKSKRRTGEKEDRRCNGVGLCIEHGGWSHLSRSRWSRPTEKETPPRLKRVPNSFGSVRKLLPISRRFARSLPRAEPRRFDE